MIQSNDFRQYSKNNSFNFCRSKICDKSKNVGVREDTAFDIKRPFHGQQAYISAACYFETTREKQ